VIARAGAACGARHLGRRAIPVTFDENHHLPSGVLIVAHHDFSISAVNPPS
jgi:hypothetical protein